MLKKILSVIALSAAFGLTACNSPDQAYTVQILGNAYDTAGKPISGLVGQFCWTLRFKSTPDVSQCDPISTNGEGQFSDVASGESKGSGWGQADDTLIGYNTYLEVNGVKYSGKTVQTNMPTADNASEKFDFSLVIDFTVN